MTNTIIFQSLVHCETLTMAVIEDQAFVTAIAHACKHPYTTVVGLLLGKSDGKTVTVTKAVPLVHHNHQLTMATEAALMQVNLLFDASDIQRAVMYVARWMSIALLGSCLLLEYIKLLRMQPHGHCE
jgi:hypothetical protein